MRRHRQESSKKGHDSQIGRRDTARRSVEQASPIVPGVIKEKFKSGIVFKRTSSFGVPKRQVSVKLSEKAAFRQGMVNLVEKAYYNTESFDY